MAKIGFLEVEEGVRSAGRLVYTLGMFWLICILTWIIYMKIYYKLDVTWSEITLLGTGMGGVFSGTKLWQNSQENTPVT